MVVCIFNNISEVSTVLWLLRCSTLYLYHSKEPSSVLDGPADMLNAFQEVLNLIFLIIVHMFLPCNHINELSTVFHGSTDVVSNDNLRNKVSVVDAELVTQFIRF